MLKGLLSVLVVLLLTACEPRFGGWGTEPVEPFFSQDLTAFHTVDGLVLPLHVWTPPEGEEPQAVLLALHGLNDHAQGAYGEAAPKLADQGIVVYSYDHRGFGAAPRRGHWAGEADLVRDAVTAAQLVRQRHPDLRFILMGESMGGAIAMLALADGVPVDGTILLAPAVWGRSVMPWYQRLALHLTVRTLPWMTFTGRGLGFRPSDNIEMLRAWAANPLVIKATRVDVLYGLSMLMDSAFHGVENLPGPLLWLYGEKDEIVPPDPTHAAAARLSAERRQRLVLYPEGWHMLLRDLQGDVVIGDVATWVLDPLSPLPSEQD